MTFGAFIRIGIVWALACAALIALVVQESRARAAGTEARFAMQAIDPRSVLSGHYVIVDLQRPLAAPAPCPIQNGPDGSADAWVQRSGWLALRQDPDGASVISVHETRASALAASHLVAFGHYSCRASTPAGTTEFNGVTEDRAAADGWENIDIGISRFHINQTDALAIEALLREQIGAEEAQVFAIVLLGADGRARLLGLEVKGERLMLSWR